MRKRTAAASAIVIGVFATPSFAQVTREGWYPGSSSIVEAEIIPPAYRGVWGSNIEACRDEDGVNRMAVFSNGLELYESGGRLERVTQAGQLRSIRLKFAYEGEGNFWDRIETWTLDASGNVLTISEGEHDTPIQMVRCQ